MTKNIIIIGRGTIAVNCLNILRKKNYMPAAVICDIFDEGKDTWTKSLFKRAKEMGYREGENLFKERRVNSAEFINILHRHFPDIDIIFSFQPYAIFHMPFIQLARQYVVNLHFAPLPKLRGVAPCSWAFLDGLKKMGVTLHLIEDFGVDNGPIIAQRLFDINASDTAWTLFNKCIEISTKLFDSQIEKIVRGNITTKKQNDKLSSYHPKNELDFTHMEIDLNKTPKEIVAFVRSRIFPPFQLPHVIFHGQRQYIDKVKPSQKKSIWFKGNTMYYSGT